MSEAEDDGPEQGRNLLAIQVKDRVALLHDITLLMPILFLVSPLGKIPQVVRAAKGRRQL